MSFIYDLADTWNAGGTTFTAIKMNVTDTASAAGSLLMDLQVGGVSQLSVSKTGGVVATRGGLWQWGASGTPYAQLTTSSAPIFTLGASGSLAWRSDTSVSAGLNDLFLARDAANTLAQRNGANAQAFRLYNTYTDASNYERLSIAWASNVVTIGAENAGTGTLRSLSFASGGTGRFTLSTSGHLLANADNSYDIGASGANRPRNVYAANTIDSAGTIVSAGYTRANRLQITDGITAPPAAVGQAMLYVDSADGDLKVIFGDGVIKTIATDT